MSTQRPGFRICAERCDECLFGKDKIVSEARKREVIQAARQDRGYFICHKTDGACCRGFFNAYGRDIQIYQIASRLSSAGTYQYVIWVDAAGNAVAQPADAPEWTGRV